MNRVISKIFDCISKIWKHDEYLISLEDDTGSEETWIAEPQSKCQEVRQRYVKFKSEFCIKLEQKAVRRAKDVEYDTFIKLYKKLEHSMEANYPLETISRNF